MERLTPFIVIFILFPVEAIGSILTIIYCTVKGMDSITDMSGAKEGFLLGISLEREVWRFFKSYTTNLIRKYNPRK